VEDEVENSGKEIDDDSTKPESQPEQTTRA
jgi:hypothetical protein